MEEFPSTAPLSTCTLAETLANIALRHPHLSSGRHREYMQDCIDAALMSFTDALSAPTWRAQTDSAAHLLERTAGLLQSLVAVRADGRIELRSLRQHDLVSALREILAWFRAQHLPVLRRLDMALQAFEILQISEGVVTDVHTSP